MITIFFWALMLLSCSIIPVLIGLRNHHSQKQDR